MPRTSRARLPIRPRQRLEWHRTSDTDFTLLAASSSIITTLLIPLGVTYTVLRIRGILHVASDQVAAVEGQHGAFGAAVVTDQAATTGITAMPKPVDDGNGDIWPMYVMFQQGGNDLDRVGREYMIDSKDKRRIPDGKQLAFILQNASTTTDMRFSVALSILVART